MRWVKKEAGLVARDLETRVFLAPGTLNELELAPEGWTTLRGTLEFAGAMPAVVPVRLVPLAGGKPSKEGRRGGFAHDGRFELENLAAGTWRVEAELDLPGGKRVSAASVVTLPASGVAVVELGALEQR